MYSLHQPYSVFLDTPQTHAQLDTPLGYTHTPGHTSGLTHAHTHTHILDTPHPWTYTPPTHTTSGHTPPLDSPSFPMVTAADDPHLTDMHSYVTCTCSYLRLNVNVLDTKLSHDESEHGDVRQSLSMKVTTKTHWSQRSLASCLKLTESLLRSIGII